MKENQTRYTFLAKKEKLIDTLIYSSGFFGLAMTIPQITKIWIGKNASGVSAIAWLSYILIALVWIAYGSIHKKKPIIITYVLWLICYIFILGGIALYG
ncbi:hypothetical protein HOE37_05720 [Candidatus Woesearchaeota archaeon]|jgi:uncharacterized protein with PQ loop repeat|nr:hypothetical protein [Candidatus Woesearchaeota archaeon]MBT4111331.1 hypothetical protein [Candidatus Woesearchaeota archaeon]MBT4336490.1 hypothetical protein [Candidatus Woesearchaeota archaeon]MBT4469903.1 hypothetical protein [Candidatus Woesearchaeota archaeon]MBT6744426.1 hypothetical protein [Candidatus Woesearchaeota archaeon]